MRFLPSVEEASSLECPLTLKIRESLQELVPDREARVLLLVENSWKSNRHHKQRLAAAKPGCFNRQKQLEKRTIDDGEYLPRLATT